MGESSLKRRIVVCIDEFQQVGDFPDSLRFQKILRGVWQHQEMTSYCLFGSKKHLMDALFLKRSYPFYKFGTIIGKRKCNPLSCLRFETADFHLERGGGIGPKMPYYIRFNDRRRLFCRKFIKILILNN